MEQVPSPQHVTYFRRSGYQRKFSDLAMREHLSLSLCMPKKPICKWLWQQPPEELSIIERVRKGKTLWSETFRLKNKAKSTRCGIFLSPLFPTPGSLNSESLIREDGTLLFQMNSGNLHILSSRIDFLCGPWRHQMFLLRTNGAQFFVLKSEKLARPIK